MPCWNDQPLRFTAMVIWKQMDPRIGLRWSICGPPSSGSPIRAGWDGPDTGQGACGSLGVVDQSPEIDKHHIRVHRSFHGTRIMVPGVELKGICLLIADRHRKVHLTSLFYRASLVRFCSAACSSSLG